MIKALDLAQGTITLATEAVPAIKWPAMTMPFKISKDLATGLKPGDRVNVEFTAKGMDATISKIATMK